MSGKIDSVKKQTSLILFISLVNVALLSRGHASYGSMLVLLSIGMFLAVVFFSPREYFLPLMMFYLPWSSLLRTNPQSSSFHSIVLLLVFVPFMISWLKNDGDLRKSYIAISLIFIAYTLGMKFFSQLPIDPQYIFFITMIMFFPIYLEKYSARIHFDSAMLFLVLGNLSACISSMILINNQAIAQFMVFNQDAVVGLRVSAYYDDPNFFAAQMLVAVAGLMIIVTKTKKSTTLIWSVVLIASLLYFALQAVSKAFLLTAAVVFALWLFNFLLQRRSILYKLYVISIIGVAVFIILRSNIFADQIEYYLLRFGGVNDAASLTTGRWQLWQVYGNYILENIEKLIFGIGLSDEWWLWNLLESNNVHMTLIQIVYQLGLIGATILFLWWKSLFNSFMEKSKISFTDFGNMMIMAAAVFVPWFGLDVLYFREFFYFPILLLLLKRYLWENSSEVGEKRFEKAQWIEKSKKVEADYSSQSYK